MSHILYRWGRWAAGHPWRTVGSWVLLAVAVAALASTVGHPLDNTMSELAERVLLSPAGTTHLVTRLERDHLVRREVDPTDGRKWFTVLTEEGDRALSNARPSHNEVLRRTLLAATSPTDRRVLRRIWKRLSTRTPNPTEAT